MIYIIIITVLYLAWYWTKEPYRRAKTVKGFLVQFLPFYWCFATAVIKLKSIKIKILVIYIERVGGKHD